MNCYVMNFLCSRDIIHPLPCSLIITYILVPHLNVDKGVLVPINAINWSILPLYWMNHLHLSNKLCSIFPILLSSLSENFHMPTVPQNSSVSNEVSQLIPKTWNGPIFFCKSPKFLYIREKRRSAARMYSMVLFSYAPPQFWPLGSPKSQFCQKQLLLAALGLE